MPGNRSKELGERLKKLRNTLGLEQPEFAKAIGVGSKNSIISWEKGRTIPNPNKILLIESVFSVNPEWLRHGDGSMFTNEAKLRSLREQVAGVVNRKNSHTIYIWALAGAGDPFESTEGAHPLETIDVSNLLNIKYRDAFRVWGDSMEPVVRHNALVFVDFNDKRIRSGEIYALNIPSEGLVVKELRVTKEHVVIYSYNEARYPPYHYEHEEIGEGNIIVGRITLIHSEQNK